MLEEYICIHLGIVLGKTPVSDSKNDSYFYIVRTPYDGFKYMETNESLERYDFIFYKEVKAKDFNPNKVFFFKRFKDVKIIEFQDSSLRWRAAIIPKEEDFCIVKTFWEDKYELHYYFKEEYDMYFGDMLFANNTSQEIKGREYDLID